MKKIGEIKGVPVVEGNINEVTKNQIHYKEDSGNIQLSKRGNDNKLNSVTGSSGGGSSRIEYWGISDKFNINATVEDDIDSFALNMYISMSAASIKGIDLRDNISITSSGFLCNYLENNNSNYFKSYKAFIFAPISSSNEEYNNFNDVIKAFNEEGATLDDLVYPITEEEFYKLD